MGSDVLLALVAITALSFDFTNGFHDTGKAHAIGGSAGVIVDLVVLIGLASTIYLRSRSSRVGHDNVNAEWTGGVAPAGAGIAPEPATA